MTTFNALLAGAIAMASITIGLFFFGFWRSTRDRFFVFFALAFMLEAIHRILIAIVAQPEEHASAYYLVRLAAYVLILLAILDKNRSRSKE
ncbi:MAG TPA: DUF5985 family protein [Noviherbaspirillum sp.]